MNDPSTGGPAVATVCVTGMHRSGTSFAARTLDLLGVSLGDPDALMPPGSDNPAGYWENRYIKELDDEVLARLDGAWDQPPVLDPGWERDTRLDDLRDRATAILAASFGSDAPAGGWRAWKDPRLSLLLPFWRTVSPITTTIVVVRHPAEVTASLAKRNAMPSGQAALLWLRYLFAATAADPGHLLIDHQSFFDDLPTTLARIAAHLGLAPPDRTAEATVQADIDPTLHHHVAAATEPAGEDNPLASLADLVWNDGQVDLRALPSPVCDAIARGWLRPPTDGEALARARAEVVELTERARRRKRARLAAEAAARDGS